MQIQCITLGYKHKKPQHNLGLYTLKSKIYIYKQNHKAYSQLYIWTQRISLVYVHKYPYSNLGLYVLIQSQTFIYR